MRARIAAAVAGVVLTAGCSSAPAPPDEVNVPPVPVSPAGAQQITNAPPAVDAECDREASLRPGSQPLPGAMPSGSTMADIVERGRLVVGVDQNTFPFGFRNPNTGQLEGFDIDVAREVARALFGDPDRVDLRVVDASQRQSALTSDRVDLVVRTYSITCERKHDIQFSTVYFYANQRILAAKGSGIDTAAELGDRRVCAVTGTTSMTNLFAMAPRPELVEVATWTDCLVMLQQGQVDAISTDDAVLAGLAEQDPTVEIAGPSLAIEPYGVGVNKDNEDLVRFVNGVLDRMRTDGTWQRLYDKWLLSSLGPTPGPPPARYGER